MRVLFMGTPDFAVPCLERIAADGHELCGVFTQPDKPFGRRQILTPPPVKTAALRMGVPVWQPAALRDGGAEKIIRGLEPDVIAVTAYGKILPQSILDIPPEGCINVHASLLPKPTAARPPCSGP
jgi:methionyl-tRNA formyltransferase